MSFNKAPIKRFNEEEGCAPPSTKYTPHFNNDVKGLTFDGYSGRGLDTKLAKEGEFLVPQLTPGRSRQLYRNRNSNLSRSGSRSVSSERYASTSSLKTPSKGGKKVLKDDTELDAAINTVESQKMQDLVTQRNREIEELQMDFLNKVEHLEQQLQESRNELSEKLIEIDSYKNIQTQLENLQQIIGSLTDKTDNLQDNLDKRSFEVEALQIDHLKKVEDLEHELQQTRTELADRLAEIESGKECLAQLDIALVQKKELIATFDQNQINMNDLLSQKDQEISKIQLDLSQAMEDFSHRNSYIESELTTLRQENEHLKVLEANNAALQTTHLKKIEDFEQELRQTTSELADRSAETQSNKKSLAQLEVTMARNQELISSLEQNQENMNDLLKQKDQVIVSLTESTKNLEDNLTQQKIEVEELQIVHLNKVKEIEHELQETRSEIADRLAEIESDRKCRAQLEETLAQKEELISTLDQNQISMNDLLNQKEQVIVSLIENTKMLADNLAKRKIEVEELKIAHLNKVEEIENGLQQTRSELADRLSEIESDRECRAQLETALVQKQELISTLDENQINMNDLLNQKEQVIVLLTDNTKNLEDNLAKRNVKVDELQIAHLKCLKRVEDLDHELQQTRTDLAGKLAELESGRKCQAQLEANLSQNEQVTSALRQQEENMSALLIQKEQLTASLAEKIRNLEDDLAKRNVEVEELQIAHGERVEDVEKELRQIKSELADKLAEIESDKEGRAQLEDALAQKEELIVGLEQKQHYLDDLREMEIAELHTIHEEAINVLKSELRDSQSELSAKIKLLELEIKTNSQLEEAVAVKDKMFKTAEQELQDINAALENKKEEIEQLTVDHHDTVQRLKRQLEEQKSETLTQLENIQEAKIQFEASLEELQQINTLLSEKTDNLEANLAKRKIEVEELKIAHLNKVEEIENGLQQTRTELADSLAEIESDRKCRAQLEDTLRQKEELISSLEQQKTNMSDFLIQKEQVVESLTENTKILEDKLAKRNVEVEELQIVHLNKVKEIEHELQETRSEIADRLAEIESDRKCRAQLEEALAQKEQLISVIGQQKEKMNDILMEKEEVIVSLTDNTKNLEDNLAQRNVEVSVLQIAHLNKVKEIEHELQETRSELADRLAEMESDREYRAQLEEELSQKEELTSALRQQHENVNDILFQKNQELDKIKGDLSQVVKARERNSQIETELETLQQENEHLRNQKEKLKQSYAELAENYAQLMGHGNHRQKIQHVVKLKEDKEHLMKENAELKLKLSKKDSENSELKKRLCTTPGMPGYKKFDRSNAFKQPLKEPYVPESGDVRGSDSRQTFVIPKKAAPPAVVARIRQDSRREAGHGMAFEIEFDNKEN